ncbi:MAG: histidine kinase [Candidatus Thiodiazotropha sp. (ex Semelilucina semeliformis)]|nr:histidine kinase [Candidatus Thiodiazotropha sp. (ex Semelilucina semeliformis)]
MKQGSRQSKQREASVEAGPAIFLPSFCAIRSVFAVVVTGELLAILFTLASVEEMGDFLKQLSLISLMVQWIGLSTAGLLCLMRGWLLRLGNQMAGLTAFLLLMMMTALICLMTGWIDQAQGLELFKPEQELLLRAMGISAIVGLLVLHYLYLQFLWRRQVEAENSARLQALHSRIRPHFLFNSMNTIASLTRSDPELAERVVEDLADLFRVSLGDASRPSNLGRELELARQYLSIEEVRLGDRLQAEWDLKELPEQAMIPPMILQPLLENAVYHGIEPSAEGGTISITGCYRRRRINLSIRNSLPSADEVSHRQGNQLAMDNIRARLAGVFDMEASLTESHVDGEHQVRLVFPHPWRT